MKVVTLEFEWSFPNPVPMEWDNWGQCGEEGSAYGEGVDYLEIAQGIIRFNCGSQGPTAVMIRCGDRVLARWSRHDELLAAQEVTLA